jgi:hypothetical protein
MGTLGIPHVGNHRLCCRLRARFGQIEGGHNGVALVSPLLRSVVHHPQRRLERPLHTRRCPPLPRAVTLFP